MPRHHSETASSVEHADQGTYTFVRPFLFVWRKGHELSPLAADYVAYVMSREGQASLALAGLVKGKLPAP